MTAKALCGTRSVRASSRLPPQLQPPYVGLDTEFRWLADADKSGLTRTKEFRFPEVALKVPEVAWLMSTRRRNERIWHQA